MSGTENRLRYAAALMMAAEQAELSIFARHDGRVFVQGEDDMVKLMQPELCQFKTEISYLLSHVRLQTEALLKRVRYPASGRQKIRRHGATK